MVAGDIVWGRLRVTIGSVVNGRGHRAGAEAGCRFRLANHVLEFNDQVLEMEVSIAQPKIS